MKSKKSKMIVLIVVLIQIVLVAGVLAYVYFETDVFKTDKQVFFEYISEIELIDSNLETYFDKVLSTPYESNISLSVSSDDSTINNVLGLVDLTIDSKVDVQNRIEERTIDLSYDGNSIFPLKLLVNGDNVGFQTSHISPKYLATNVNEQIPTTEEVLLGLEAMVKQYVQLAKETDMAVVNEIIAHIAGNYAEVVYKNLSNDKFSVEENENQKGYTVTINQTDMLLISKEVCIMLKSDEYLQNKLVEILKIEVDTSMIVELLDETINDINSKLANASLTTDDEMKITVWVENKKAVGIEVEMNQVILNVVKVATDDESLIEVSIESLEDGIKIAMNATYKGLADSQKVEELIVFSIDMNEMNAEIKSIGTTVFKEVIEVDQFNNETALFLSSGRTLDQNDKLWIAIEERIEEVVFEKITEIMNGSFDENIPSYDTEHTQNTTMTVQENNEQYSIYQGQEVRGSIVRGLFSVIEKNLVEDTCSIKYVYLDEEMYTIENTAEEIKELIGTEKMYTVTMETDKNDYIHQVTLTEIEVSE